MSDNAAPPAGWYPSPYDPANLQWWDGVEWQPHTRPAEPAVTSAPPAYAPSMPTYPSSMPTYPSSMPTYAPSGPLYAPRVAGLATALRWLLIVCGLSSVVTIAVELFGVTAIGAYLGGDLSTEPLLDVYDSTSTVVAGASLLFLVATGIVWVIWQYRLARAVAGRIRRGPGWHVGSWIIPVVSFWFPYQNISDLWRAYGRSVPRWQIAWWLLWLGGGVVGQVAARMAYASDSIDIIVASMWLTMLGEALTLAAVPLAIRLVSTLTRSAADATASSY